MRRCARLPSSHASPSAHMTHARTVCTPRAAPTPSAALRPLQRSTLRCVLPRRFIAAQSKPPANETTYTQSGKPASLPAPLWRRILTRIEQDSPYPPYSKQWWTDKAIVFGVFGVTGSSTMFFVRPLLTDVLHIEPGTWSYLLASILLISPSYTILLVLFGTLAGRREYFVKIAKRMWGRFLPFLREPKQPPTSSPPSTN